MKKRYSREFICEALAYWNKKLLLAEASGSEPFAVGNEVVEKTMAGLNDMLLNAEIVNAADIDSLYSNDPKKVYIANVGSRNAPGDIVVVFKDFTTGQRTDVVLEVKASQSSSLF